MLSLVYCFTATPSAAQTPGGAPFGVGGPSRPERPYRGLFGGGVGSTSELLTLEASAGGGAVSNPHAAQSAPVAAGGGNVGGGSAYGSAHLEYTRSGERIGMNASNLATLDYYPHVIDGKMRPRDIASGGVYFTLSRRTRVEVGGTFKDVPEFSLLDLFEADEGPGIGPSRDIALTVDRYRRYGTSVDVTQQLSRRSRFVGSAAYAHGMLPTRQWTILTFSGDFTYNISKGLGLDLGYQYGGQKDQGKPRERHPRINAGINYNRPLSFTRRTTLSFSTGTAGTHDREEDQTNYYLIGGVKLNHEFGQTWNASLFYTKNVRYIETYNEPLLYNSISSVVSGSFTRQLNFQAGFGLSSGHLGTTDDTSMDVENYSATAQISFALTRYMALATAYEYHRYSFKGGGLSIAALGERDRQSLMVSLQVWAPLIRRTRQ